MAAHVHKNREIQEKVNKSPRMNSTSHEEGSVFLSGARGRGFWSRSVRARTGKESFVSEVNHLGEVSQGETKERPGEQKGTKKVYI